MRAQIVGIAAIVTLAFAPAVWAGSDPDWKSEEARLTARISEQQVRIQQLEAQLAALSPRMSARQPMPLRAGLSARDLWVVRGKPDFVSRTGNSIEVWGYGAIRVTLINGRVTSWQKLTITVPPSPVTEQRPITAGSAPRPPVGSLADDPSPEP